MASLAPSDGGSYNPQGFLVDSSRKFSPMMAMVIIVLLAGCFVLAFVSVVVRRCFRERAAAQSGGGPQSSGSYPTKLTRGLEKADVDALPLMRGADLGNKDDHECPVCLTDFAQEDTVRLLPACKHVFHQGCIDAWFDSHSTCPLCRASLVGCQDSSAVLPEATPVHAPHATHIHDASENEDSDTEVHGGARHGASSRGLTGSRTLNTVISREGSVRGSLTRSAESEAAHESAADKAPSFTKPLSLSADLVALRNLLIGADQSRAVTASEAPLWSARARKLELDSKHQLPTQEEWVTIDLESGQVQAQPSTSSESKLPGAPAASAAAAAPERSWSDRFSLSRIRSSKGIAMLSRSTSDLSSRHASPLPM